VWNEVKDEISCFVIFTHLDVNKEKEMSGMLVVQDLMDVFPTCKTTYKRVS